MQKIKVILVVVGLLLTGFVGGFLTNRYLVKDRIHHLRRMDAGKDFGSYLLDKIKPDAVQARQLQPILTDFGQQFKSLGQQHQLERQQLTDSLFTILTPLLHEDQLDASRQWRRLLSRGPGKTLHKRGGRKNK
ncbi:MAG: hypothetical protein DA408_01475 [Bacteroidetes bacterium]|nr:MAG: hypothetical protein C7N36_01410 [Bacteroidota bacterium]PTM14989.1 MAG: hypothetical protein DA408_01475 [Bacteroidota bacterium]